MDKETKASKLISSIISILSDEGLDDNEKYEDFTYVVEEALKSTYRAGWIRANAMNYEEGYFIQYNEQGYLS